MFVAKPCVRSDRVVVAPPAFDDDLRFAQGVEDLAVEQFVAKAGIKALDVAVLPRTAGFDVGGLGTNRGDPLLHGFGDKLWSIVGSDMAGDAPQIPFADIRHRAPRLAQARTDALPDNSRSEPSR